MSISSDLLAFFKWYLAITAVGALAYPLVFRLLPHLPDRGYPLARTFGLLLLSWIFWLMGSVGLVRNEVGGILLAGAVVAGLSVWALQHGGAQEWLVWLRAQRGTILAAEGVFLAAFAALAWVRAHNPNIIGTEKPMEYMFINSIMRSGTFPPADAWLSGHAISYYYFGYFMVAMLARLTGTSTAVAFNLALALLFALTAAGALSVAMNLMTLTPRGEAEETPRPRRLADTFWPALLAPVLVLVAGNFYGVLKLAHANGWWTTTQIPAVYYDFGTLKDPAAYPQSLEDFSSPPGVRVGWVGLWKWLNLKGIGETGIQPPAQPVTDLGFWWWFSGARVVHDRNLTGVETEAIDEMPAFSFILGDLHPHVLALPFVVLAITLALEWLLWGLTAGEWSDGWRAALRPSSLAAQVWVSALSLGGLAFINTWDFPIYWFVLTVALVAGLGLGWGWEALWQRWRIWLPLPVIIAVLSLLLYVPFYFTFQNQAGGILPNLIYPSRFQQLVVFFGPVWVGVSLWMAWLAYRARPGLDIKVVVAVGGGMVLALLLVLLVLVVAASFSPQLSSFVDGAIVPLTRAQASTLLWQRRLVDCVSALFPALLIGLTVSLGVGAARRIGAPWLRSPGVLMALVLVLTGALLLIGPEFVYLRDNFGSRMNTIFKFYFQTWMLWALAAAYGIWLIGQQAGRLGRGLAAAAMVLSVTAGLLYTGPALQSKFSSDRGPAGATLDGMASFAAQYPDDWAAIQWLQANVSGQPVIAEGIGGSYWIEGRFSRFSMATGLPTVMGWPGHEGQWRGAYIAKVAGRESEIRDLYQTRDWSTAKAILDRYAIEYVVVSSLERDKYKPAYQVKFDQHMRVAFQIGDVTIYQRLESQ